MDCYMWVEPVGADSLMIPYNDAADVFLHAQFSNLVEKPNASLIKTHKAYLIPESGSDLAKFNTLIGTTCSHDDVDHKTCAADPDCGERLRLIPQIPAGQKNAG